MTVNIAPSPRQQFEDVNGLPIAGGKLFTYLSGTTTKQATYTDSTGATANTNPIILDSSGRTPSGVWLTNGISYKFVLALSTDTDPPTSPILTENGLTGINAQPDITLSEWLPQIIAPTYISATSFSLPLDQTTEFHYGRRVKLTTSTGFRYGTIRTSVFTTLTTITVFLDSGSLDSSLSAIELGLISKSNSSLPVLTNRFNKNILINPGFTVNQRVYASGAVLASGVYGHDRWKAGTGGGDYSFTQLNSNTAITIAANKTLIQVVENKNVQSATYVLSWTGTATARVGIDSATPSGAYAASPIVITTQTPGTTMSVEFGNGASSGTLSNVQLEAGNIATSIEHRSFADELFLCQRYYEKSYEYAVAPGTVAAIGAWEGVNINTTDFYSGGLYFKVPKRDAPTMTGYSSGTGATNVLYKDSAAADQGNTGFTSPGINGVRRVNCSNAAMTGTTGIFSTQWTADAE